MDFSIIDTPQPVQRFLSRLGTIDTIIRYITSRSPNSAKHIQIREARAIKAAGKKLAIVHEVWGDFKHAGHGGISVADGRYDGRYAVTCLVNLGAPAGAACYFAVDTDATTSQLRNNVLPYFQAVHEAFKASGYRVGIYGPGALCQAVKDAGYAELCWLANAKGWKGYKAFLGQEDLLQHIPTHIAGGLDVDPNTTDKEDWGQFDPFTADEELAPLDPELGRELEQRLGQGDDKPLTFADVPSEGNDLPSVLLGKAKSLFSSKIAWLSGGLGSTAATNAALSDPQVTSLLGQLVGRPSFWIAVVCIGAAAAVIYYRWRDHGRGQ